MTRRDYVIVSTTGTILFLISIPWFLLVKNHLMLEPPYFRVDPSFVQQEESRQDALAPARGSVDHTTRDAQERMVTKSPLSPVQLINLPTARVGALVHVEPRQVETPREQPVSTQTIEAAEPVKDPVKDPGKVSPTAAPPAAAEQAAAIRQPVKQPAPTQPTVLQTGPELYGIQVAAFKRQANARELARTYENTATEVHVVTTDSRGKRWYRVILGGFRDKHDAEQFGQALKAVRGDMETRLVSFQSSSQSGNGD